MICDCFRAYNYSKYFLPFCLLTLQLSIGKLNMEKDTPDESKYTDDRRSISEILFSLNLYGHKKEEIDYSFLCLETVDLWLSLNIGSWNYFSNKGIAYTFCIRGRRLLRAGQFMLFKGYLPESEILLRSLWETLMTLTYIIEDPSEERAKKYSSFDYKSGWDFRLLTENLLGENAYETYRNLSLYVHPTNLGRGKMFYINSFYKDSIHNYDYAGELLVTFGNKAVALCEVSNKIFDPKPEWISKHNEIYQTDIFKKNYDKVSNLYNQGDPTILALQKWINQFGVTEDESEGVG